MALRNVVVALSLFGAQGLVVPSARISRVQRLQSTPGSGPSLQYNPEKFTDKANAGNFRKLSDALKDGDIERKLADEAQYKREQAMEFAREERRRKIAFMDSVPDDTVVGKVRARRELYLAVSVGLLTSPISPASPVQRCQTSCTRAA